MGKIQEEDNAKELKAIQKHVIARIANKISTSGLSDEKKLLDIGNMMYLYEKARKKISPPFDITRVLR